MAISILLPTKKYIKAYLINQLGEKPLMNTTTLFGSKFYDLLQHKEPSENEIEIGYNFNSEIKVYINIHTFRHRGCFISKSNAKSFNDFVESYIKNHYRTCMDFYVSIFPNFMVHLPDVRKQIGIDIDHWDDDSMKKDYYRYRKRNGLPLLYKTENIGCRAKNFGKEIKYVKKSLD